MVLLIVIILTLNLIKTQQPQSREDTLLKQVEKAEEEWRQVRAQAHIEKERRRARAQQRQRQERERG